MIHPKELPRVTSETCDLATPLSYVAILFFSTRSDASIRLNDPVHNTYIRLLNRNPVRIIEANFAAWINVVNPNGHTRGALVSRTKGCESRDITAPVKKLCEFPLKEVMGCHEVKNRLLCLQGRKVAPPRKWLRRRKLVTSVGEFNLITLNSMTRDCWCKILCNRFANLWLRKKLSNSMIRE